MKKISLWLLLAVPVLSIAQDLNQPIPLDPSVRTGTLKNGLTYYIKKNAKPENKVDLRLVVNAGSLMEDDDQQGLAHFMEHMNFNGTKRFPKNKLVDYLQSIGVKFGQHLNAYTSFDETVYFLPIPSDDAEKLEKGFQILEDWAFNAVLTPEEIDKERGVVLEEYRLGLGASDRMSKRFLPKMLYQSHYAERLPIGKKDILENFKHETLIRFYKDWYRPDLMAVIVVGDIDVDAMEKKIKTHFESYKNPKKERPRLKYDLPNHEETFVCIETDKEASNSDVRVYYKDKGKEKPTVTLADYRRNRIEDLYTTMINNRLQELTNDANPPFMFGYSYHGGGWVREKEQYQSFAITPETKQLDALKALIYENLRVKKYGFGQGELDRAKEEILSYAEKAYNERDKTESSSFVGRYQSFYLEKYPVPSEEWSFETQKALLPGITLSEVNALISGFIHNDNRVIVMTGPEKDDLKKPTEAEVLAVINATDADIKPYVDTEVAKSLLKAEPKPGSITKREKNEKLGTVTLTLSNGAKVTYKKTDFKNEEILMQATSRGGTDLYSPEVYKKIYLAMYALDEAGFSGLKKNDITKFLNGKIVSVFPYVSDVSEGMQGNTTPKDLEYLMQMVYAYFTDLNYDPQALEIHKQKQSAFMDNMLRDPNYFFMSEISAIKSKGNPRYFGMIPTEKDWAGIDYKTAYNVFKERFANAADFEFFFVGNIDEAKFETLVDKYLASLPATNAAKEKVVDVGFRPAKPDLKKIVNKGTDPKSSVRISYYGEATYNEKEARALNALGEILTIKLIEQLRETESGVYGISASGSMSKVPYGSYNFDIRFPCGPENAEKLTQSALNELQKIVTNGPEAKDLAKYKEAELLEYKKNLKENRFWLRGLTNAYSMESNPEALLKKEEAINALTAKEVQDVAKKYITTNKLIAILMPEEAK
ncbi:M16 family metallopeptidase [Flavobacterium sp. RHBU_3]|uniref:M16 family metallopeptidase n=1 Tax=Flavobacterium sp. RHBU_3 TaxID=3391184 RepID=UPI003984C26E